MSTRTYQDSRNFKNALWRRLDAAGAPSNVVVMTTGSQREWDVVWDMGICTVKRVGGGYELRCPGGARMNYPKGGDGMDSMVADIMYAIAESER